MADWPRWIDDATVDSSAMAIAYIQWVRSERLSGREPELLPEVRHFPQVTAAETICQSSCLSGVDLPWIPCTTLACDRCLGERGGYKFRWYSHKWQEMYRNYKRPGSWVVGVPSPQIKITADRDAIMPQIKVTADRDAV